jgi:trans-aconitate methyltransferase
MAYWFEPAELARAEEEVRAKGTVKGDFGSYAAANRTGRLSGSGIENHNLVHADGRVRQYAHVLGGRDFADIADMGCGLGLTADALARAFPGARVVGYEMSQDAVDFASRQFPNASFRQLGLAADSRLDRSFDLILCQEFYPFTRTADWAYQRPLLDNLIAHLRPGGVLLIELSERDAGKSILVNLPAMASYKPVVRRLPFDRVFRKIAAWLPAQAVSAVLSRLLGRPRNVAVLIERT